MFFKYLRLIIFALSLAILIVPTSIVYKFLAALLSKKPKNLTNWIRRLTLTVDQFGNVACDDLFNKILIKQPAKYPFGKEAETISSVLGKNYRDNNLKIAGKFLQVSLDFLDKNHTINSIRD